MKLDPHGPWIGPDDDEEVIDYYHIRSRHVLGRKQKKFDKSAIYMLIKIKFLQYEVVRMRSRGRGGD